MVILSIQDPGLMLLGVTRWFMVNLMFGVMILSIQDLYLEWRFVILSIQDLDLTFFRRPFRSKISNEDTVILSIQDSSLMIVRCGPVVHSQHYVWSDDSLDTKSRSPVKIRNPLVLKRSRLQSHISFFGKMAHDPLIFV